MKLNVKALTLTVAVIWGGTVLMVGLINLIWNGYGVAFLQVVASIYPGYGGAASFRSVVIATLYALVDGGFGGLILAAVYNLFVGRFRSDESTTEAVAP